MLTETSFLHYHISCECFCMLCLRARSEHQAETFIRLKSTSGRNCELICCHFSFNHRTDSILGAFPSFNLTPPVIASDFLSVQLFISQKPPLDALRFVNIFQSEAKHRRSIHRKKTLGQFDCCFQFVKTFERSEKFFFLFAYHHCCKGIHSNFDFLAF